MDDGSLVLSDYNMVIPAKKRRVVIIVAGTIILGVSIYLFLTAKERAINKGAERFIEAVITGDFDIIYEYHAPSQKKVALSANNATDVELRLKQVYKEQKASFEDAQPTANLVDQWSAKFLFIKDMRFQIASIEMVEDIEKPSHLSPKKKIDAYVEVDVEYTNKETAPDLGGKIKKVIYQIKLVHSKNVSRIWEGKLQDDRWLFKSIVIKDGSLIFW